MKTNKRIRGEKSLIGKRVIESIGTMSVLLEFLDIKSRFISNLICKNFYRLVMPGVSGSFLIKTPRHCTDWLDWGHKAAASELEVRRSLSIRIGNEKGTCYGEWQKYG